MRTRREVLSGLGAIPLAAALPQADRLAEARKDRDKELLVEATTYLADDRPTRARLLLHTILEVYPESPLVPLAETLLFYSLARERTYLIDGSPVDGGNILAEIHEYVARYRRPPGVTD